MKDDIYKGCMLIGHRFNQKYSTEETDDWSGSEECSTVARLTYTLTNTLNVSMEKALDIVMEIAMNQGFRNVEEHMWDDYCRGFLAGEIIGMPTEENLQKVNEAEELWLDDRYGKYGYYQEVLEEVSNKNKTNLL